MFENTERPDELALLLNAYVELNRMKACEPGERSHMLATSIQWIERQIKEVLKGRK